MMDLQCAVSVQETGDNKDPPVTLNAPSLPGLLLKPCLFNSGLMEGQAVSMTNADSTATLPSSPAEASLAKLAIASPTTITTTTDGAVFDKSPTTSDIASASDSLASTGTSLAETTPAQQRQTITIMEAVQSSLPSLAASSNGVLTVDSVQKSNSPAVLNFKGISVSLENNTVWKQFHAYGTEMILTKSGRRMFPYCRYRLSGLVPTQRYSLVLSIVPADQHKYRWNAKKWEVIGAAEHQAQGLIRAFPHQNSPCLGSEWMNTLVSFYKLKLTNNIHDQEGHMILHSMHRYIPRLHVIPVLDGDGPTPDQPVIKGPESMTFTFPQTEFVSVTTYQNPWIIQLKINHNPFAKGFREEGVHPRLCKPKPGNLGINKVILNLEGTKDAQSPLTKPAGNSSSSMETGSKKTVLPCTKKPTATAPPRDAQESKSHAERTEAAGRCEPDVSVSKEVTEVVSTERSTPTPSPHPTPPPKRPRGRPRKRRNADISPTPPAAPRLSSWSTRAAAAAAAVATAAAAAAAATVVAAAAVVPEESDEDFQSTPANLRKKKRANRRWGNSRGRDAKLGATASPVGSPALPVTVQPESDDVEGLLFVSFTSKEALGLHLGDRAMGNTGSLSAQESPVTSDRTGEAPETEEKAMTRLQVVLLDDLRAHKHRQVIHPHLKDVDLNSLDPSKAIDLNCLGVHLPLPPPDLPGRGNTTPLSPTVGGSAFVSRTGKTSDLTKIKGWRDKFIKRSKESSASPQQDGSQKDLSAFCSNMLDEYLESEAQQISERAAAFATNPEGSVAYQLPEKSASYVKTLDSALKHRNPAARKAPARNRPCPLSHKPLLYSALTSPAPPLAPDNPGAAKAKSPRPKPAAPKAGQDAAKSSVGQTGAKASPMFLWFPADKSPQGPTSQGSQSSSAGPGPKPGPGWGQLQANLQLRGLSKLQLRMLSMEETSQNQGVRRTTLTPDRVDFALSALLTATMHPKHLWTATQYKTAAGPDCGRAFCRLGCVCSSLARRSRGPLHCRRPDCMLGCDCFKRKISKRLLGDEELTEKQPHPLYLVTSLQHEVQPSPGAHWDRIWHKHRALPDPEPLFAPKSVEGMGYFLQSPSRRAVYQPVQVQPILEKDKDPVYRYLESLMTCARIRVFKHSAKDMGSPRASPAQRSPAPALHTQPKKPKVSAKKFPNIILTFENTGKTSTMDKDSLDSTQIEILSECHWDEDRKLILGALCQRMKRGSLATPFSAGPYHISLIAKILRPKVKGSTIRYKMRIHKPKAASEDEEDVEHTSDEEEVDENDSDDGEIRSGSEEEEEEELEGEEEEEEKQQPCSPETVQIGVTPFLSRVLPAGFLQARKKPSGTNAVGLVQVNGKSYPRACLMLGSVGSLHPANRLAAYVTGRLPTANQPTANQPAANQPRNPPVSAPKGNNRPAQGVKTAAKLKDKAGMESDGSPAHSSPAPQPIKSFTTSSWHGAMVPARSTSYSSPVSITVSRSLKEPSFLAESGTYSFRICPPVANQGPAGSNGGARHPAGVTLPGGFTLIQLPKHGANGALALPVDLDKFPNRGEALVKTEVVENDVDIEDHTSAGAGDPSAPGVLEPGSSPKLMGGEKMQSGDSDDSQRNKPTTRPKSDPDRPPEDDTSEEGSDGDGDDNDGSVEGEYVDVETVEDMTKTIQQMRASCVRSIWDSSEESGSSMESKSKQNQPPCVVVEEEDEEEDEEDEEDMVDEVTGHRRRQHKVLERLRRSEQRGLFIKLQTILQLDPKAPKLRLLSQAQSEIETLVETSKSLEKQKKKLLEMQKLYIRKISCLAGKPEDLIRRKLKEVYERKQALNAQKKSLLTLNKVHQLNFRGKVTPLRQPQAPPVAPTPAPSFASPQHPHPKAPEPIAPPPLAPTPARDGSPRSQPKDLPQVPAQRPRDQVTGPSPEITTPNTQAPEKKSQEKTPPTSTPLGSAGEQQPPAPAGPQAMTLPLIRTKTGRIILPSSLKPLGQGFYTITIMEPDKETAGNDEPGEAVRPAHSDLNSSADQASKDGVTGDEPVSSSPAGDEAAASPSPTSSGPASSGPTSSGPTSSGPKKSMSPLVEIARLNKSISSLSASKPLLLRKDGANENNGASRLSFSSCSLVYIPLAQEPAKAEPAQESPEPGEPSPSVPRRRRGRPRKHPLVTPANQNTDDAVSEESTETPAAAAAGGEGEGEGGSPDKTGDAGESPVLIKRGRGRPRKKRPLEDDNPADGGGPGAKLPARTPSNQGRTRPVRDTRKSPEGARSTRTVRSPDTDREGGRGSGKRPLTRGSLGKDFPSAKRMSWIDVEKELGLD